MRRALLVLPLAACATVPTASVDMPSRATMEELLYRSDNICMFMSLRLPGEECNAVPRRQLRMLRCVADPRPDPPPRLICRYAGVRLVPGGARALRFGPECAYVSGHEGGGWRIDSYPDAEVCEF